VFGTPSGTTKEVHLSTGSPTPSPIVLIHGLWLTPLSWEYWLERFEGKGHRVLAPAWPGLDQPIEELRRNTAPYERLGITEITDHYDAIIRGLDQPPIIIGHSFGGLITLLLLDRGLGASAVAISPAQPKGVLTLPPAQARVASVALRNPANRHKAQMLTEKQFHYGFTNTLSEAESKPMRRGSGEHTVGRGDEGEKRHRDNNATRAFRRETATATVTVTSPSLPSGDGRLRAPFQEW
jgi:pimeloyl-ACP methyl ester carboxylesterase